MPFTFTQPEYTTRIQKTRAAMTARGITALIVTDPSNIAWLTGYDAWSFYVHQCAVLPAAGAPWWWGRAMDAACAAKTTQLPADDIVGYPDHYVQNPRAHPMTHLAGALAERNLSAATLGVEMDNYYYTAAAHRALTAALPDAAFTDATGLVNWQRAVKSPAEIACMTRAARIVENMHRRVFEVIEPGMRKHQLVAEVYRSGIGGVGGGGGDDGGDGHRHTLINGVGGDGAGGDGDTAADNGATADANGNDGAANGDTAGDDGANGADAAATTIAGDYPAIVPLVATGADAGAPHLTWDDRPIPRGSGTFLELAGVHRRYHCPLCRTIFLGTPPDKFRRAEDAVVEGINAGIDAAKPGNRCRDIADALNRTLARHGLAKDGRCGYAVGLSYPPDWGERTMSLRADDDTELKAGMTFHFMPGLWFDDWGIEITETILITNHTAQPLADYPRELLVKR